MGDITIPAWLGLVLMVGLPVLVLASRTWIVSRVEGAVKSSFAKQLESHKSELLLTAEAARFDYQRRFQDFALFVAKKHEANARLYRSLLETEGRVSDLLPQSFQYSPTFDDFNESDLENFLKEQEYPSAKCEEIIGLFRTSRSQAVEAFLEYRDTVRRWKAQKSKDRATRYYLFNALYLSQEVAGLCEKVLIAFQRIILDAQTPGSQHMARALIAMQESSADLKQLRGAMQNELAAGYYSPPSVTKL